MKIVSFGCRPYDEMAIFSELGERYCAEICCVRENLSSNNLHLARGADYVSVLTHPVGGELVEGLKAMGVKMLGTRTVGYDHIDCTRAREVGLRVSNSVYSPDAVAEFSLMLILMALRKAGSIIERGNINDFSLKGLIGHNLSERRVGILGLGSIGLRRAELLRGFGCEIWACDPKERELPGIKMADVKELFSSCDVISLHAPLRDTTRHIVNGETLGLMPRGSVIVNTARGGLIDTQALIDSLRSGHIGACALDVLEGEHDIFFHTKKSSVIDLPELSILKDMPNVIITPHIAFYTECSVRDMLTNCVRGFYLDSRGEENPFRIV